MLCLPIFDSCQHVMEAVPPMKTWHFRLKSSRDRRTFSDAVRGNLFATILSVPVESAEWIQRRFDSLATCHACCSHPGKEHVTVDSPRTSLRRLQGRSSGCEILVNAPESGSISRKWRATKRRRGRMRTPSGVCIRDLVRPGIITDAQERKAYHYTAEHVVGISTVGLTLQPV